MSKEKTLFLSDLDGTLLTPEQNLSAFTIETLERLVGEGMHFSYATARSLMTAKKVTAGLSARLPVITYNGAATVDSADGRVLSDVYFTPEETAFIQKVMCENGLLPMVYSRPGDNVYTEHVTYVPGNISLGLKGYLDSRAGDERFRTATSETLYNGRVFYCTAIEDSEALCTRAYEAVSADGRFTVHLQRDIYLDAYYFEVMPKGATKANAAKRLMELLGCTRLVCFGDGVNDRSMFELADAGYAVENAAPVLKEIAAAVIGSNAEDGVAKALLQLWNEK